jgi:Electron transfer DM13
VKPNGRPEPKPGRPETVTRAGFLHLGPLKGNIGDQNYDVPADADLEKHRAVTVWCRRFGVNFGTAPLFPAGGGYRGLAPRTGS